MKSKYILILLTFFIFLFLNFYISIDKTNSIFKNYTFKTITLGSKKYTLYIADNFEKQKKGLSNISYLPNNKGLLFVFKKPQHYYFWMKDMKIPLDFIFLHNNKIVDIKKNVSFLDKSTFTASEKFTIAIEINVGEINKNKIHIGDSINLSF